MEGYASRQSITESSRNVGFTEVLLQKRKEYSKATMGASSSVDLELLSHTIRSLELKTNSSVLDIGCGNGELLERIHNDHSGFSLTGMDLERFRDAEEDSFFQFITHDLNENFPDLNSTFDLIICSHVILYLENPRHLIRQVLPLLNVNGFFVVSNPNTDSFRNIVSNVSRGYDFFRPPRYPGHISGPSVYDMQRMVAEVESLEVRSINYTNRGRMPGVDIDWQSLVPFLGGSRFSDAYSMVVAKVETKEKIKAK